MSQMTIRIFCLENVGSLSRKKEKIDRKNTQNMGGLVENLCRRSSRNKPNSNKDKSDDDSDILPRKRGKPQEKKEKLVRKNTKLGGSVDGGRCSRSKQKFITDESDDNSDILPRKRGKLQKKNEKTDRNDIELGCLVEGFHGGCRRSRKFIIDESDDDHDILPIKHGKPQENNEEVDRNDTSSTEQLSLENVTSSTDSILVKPTGNNLDMAWEWNSLKDINNRQAVTCDFCLKTTNGGITRAKKHQIGLKGDVAACKNIPPSIKSKIQKAYQEKQAINDAIFGWEEEDDDEEEASEEINYRRAETRFAKRNTVKDSMDMDKLKIFEISNKLTNGMTNRKTSIRDPDIKKARAKANGHIAQFIYKNGIPLKIARSKSFKRMIEAVGDFGQHLNPPRYHELRVSEVAKEILKPYEKEQTQYGEAIEDEPVFGDDSLTLGVGGDTIEAGESSRPIRQHAKLTIVAPTEVEKEKEKQDENLKPRPKVTKVYVRRKKRFDALDQL